MFLVVVNPPSFLKSDYQFCANKQQLWTILNLKFLNVYRVCSESLACIELFEDGHINIIIKWTFHGAAIWMALVPRRLNVPQIEA